MFKKRALHTTADLLPWLLNHSLPAADQPSAEDQARRSPEQLTAWQAVRSAAVSQPLQAPPLAVRQRLLARAQVKSKMPRGLPVLSGAVLAVLALLLLWNVVQPGIGLQWSVNGALPAAFRIYRAPAGSDRFEIVREIPAQSGIIDYSYVDTALMPGQSYRYRVEAVNAETASATIAANGVDLLPTQLTIVLSSLLVGVAGAYVLREAALPRRPVNLKPV